MRKAVVGPLHLHLHLHRASRQDRTRGKSMFGLGRRDMHNSVSDRILRDNRQPKKRELSKGGTETDLWVTLHLCVTVWAMRSFHTPYGTSLRRRSLSGSLSTAHAAHAMPMPARPVCLSACVGRHAWLCDVAEIGQSRERRRESNSGQPPSNRVSPKQPPKNRPSHSHMVICGTSASDKRRYSAGSPPVILFRAA